MVVADEEMDSVKGSGSSSSTAKLEPGRKVALKKTERNRKFERKEKRGQVLWEKESGCREGILELRDKMNRRIRGVRKRVYGQEMRLRTMEGSSSQVDRPYRSPGLTAESHVLTHTQPGVGYRLRR